MADKTGKASSTRGRLWLLVAFVVLGALAAIGLMKPGADVKKSSTTQASAVPQLTPTLVVTEMSGDYDWKAVTRLLRKELDEVMDDENPKIALAAKRVFAELPQYEKIFDQISGNAEGMKVDFALNVHASSNPRPEHMHLVHVAAESQRKTLALLDQNTYDLIAGEREYPHDMTYELLPNEVMRTQQTGKANYTRKDAELHIERASKFAWDFQYLRTHRNRSVYGAEEPGPYLLMREIAKGVGVSKSQTERWNRLTLVQERSLSVLRSQLSLARILNRMRHDNKQTAILVIGFKHGNELRDMARSLGLNSRFYMNLDINIARASGSTF